MSSHGGRRSGSGRRKIHASSTEAVKFWQRGHRRIWLDCIIYSSWVSAKIKCGYESDTAFASHLLSLERRRREKNSTERYIGRKRSKKPHEGGPAKRRRHVGGAPTTSTPVRGSARPLAVESPINLSLQGSFTGSEDVDVTGISADLDVTGVSSFVVNDTIYEVENDSVVIKGDEDKYNISDSNESMSDSESALSDSSDLADIPGRVTDVLQEALIELNEDLSEHVESDDSDVEDLGPVMHETEGVSSDEDDVSEAEIPMEISVPHAPLQVVPVPISPPATVPGVSTGNVSQQQQQPPQTMQYQQQPRPQHQQQLQQQPRPQPMQYQQQPRPQHQQQLQQQPLQPQHHQQLQQQPQQQQQQPNFPKLSRLEEQSTFREELNLIRETKIICSLDLLLGLFKNCQHSGCDQPITLKYHLIGPTAVINWTCSSGHKGKFSSSKDINEMYANNIQVGAAVILSGNNFAKIEKMCSFLGLSFISESTFYRMQRLYFIPCISEWWNWQRDQLLEEFKNEEVVVCGDGQCDSPGHTAKNLCYFLMELVSGYILEIEVRDKRHVGLASSNMEKQALQNALQRLRLSLNIVEVVTDASPSIKKLIADNFATSIP